MSDKNQKKPLPSLLKNAWTSIFKTWLPRTKARETLGSATSTAQRCCHAEQWLLSPVAQQADPTSSPSRRSVNTWWQRGGCQPFSCKMKSLNLRLKPNSRAMWEWKVACFLNPAGRPIFGLSNYLSARYACVYRLFAHMSLWEGIRAAGAIAHPFMHNNTSHLRKQLERHGSAWLSSTPV